MRGLDMDYGGRRFSDYPEEILTGRKDNAGNRSIWLAGGSWKAKIQTCLLKILTGISIHREPPGKFDRRYPQTGREIAAHAFVL